MTPTARGAFALGLTLGLFVALAPSCSGSNSGGVGGGTGGTGGTGGSGVGGGNGGAGGGTSIASFCADFSASYCDYAIRCGYASGMSRSECITFVGPLYCGGAQSIVKGYQSLDSAQAALCLKAVADTTCGGSPLTGTACSNVTTSKSNTNEGCFSTGDCKNPTEGCGGANCAQTCRPAGGQGQPCPKGSSCATGLRCDYVTNTCIPPAGVGEACTYSFDCDEKTTYCDSTARTCVALPTAGQTCRNGYQCTNGYYCGTNTTCQAKLATGIACTSTSSCQDALFCDTSKTPDSCQPRLASGSVCTTFSSACQAGLNCISGTCQTPRQAGGSCTSFSDCADNLSCDSVLRSCQAYVYDLKENQTCTGYQRNCASGLVCKGAVVNPAGGMGTVGMCGLPKIGDPCTSLATSACPEASFCNLAVDGGPGTCVAASLGSPCETFGRNCLTGQYCEGGLCAAQKALGTACTGDSACVSPLQCITNPSTGAKVCGALPEVGQACSPTASTPCIFPNACVNGTCVHAGKPGEKCLNGGQCFSGRCEVDGGTCTQPLGQGAGCRSNYECASGRCFAGKCEATCP